jgi:hypothetical protein
MTTLSLRDLGFIGALAESDPLFANVIILVRGNGSNGSTTIINSSKIPYTVTAHGNAQISTAISDPFGNSSGVLAFDGSGDYIEFQGFNPPHTAGFNPESNDFTVEGWVYPLANGVMTLIAKRPARQAIGYYMCDLGFGGHIGGSWRGTVITAPQPPLNTWTYVAIVRASDTFKMYHNGIQVGSTYTQSGELQYYNVPAIIGMAGGVDEAPSNGYMSNIRCTIGARYTANFTPPTAPFPGF